MKISDITWLSREAREAEIEITSGTHKIIVFSQPCDYEVNQKVYDCIHPLDVEYLQKSYSTQVEILELMDNYFSYKIIGVIADFEKSIISVGDIKFELSVPIPSWAGEGDFIEFESIRFDLW